MSDININININILQEKLYIQGQDGLMMGLIGQRWDFYRVIIFGL